jgi:hypothetical protein
MLRYTSQKIGDYPDQKESKQAEIFLLISSFIQIAHPWKSEKRKCQAVYGDHIALYRYSLRPGPVPVSTFRSTGK